MRKMFKEMSARLAGGEDLVLVTVVASSGATPRGAGARMLVGREGRIRGTIGGGAVEYRSEHLAAEVLRDRVSGEKDFSLNRADIENLGMICGGAVIVYFSFIPAGDKNTLGVCEEAERRFEKGEDIWLLSEITAGGALTLYSREDGFFGAGVPDWTLKYMTGRPVRKTEGDREFYIEQISHSGKVYIFGCGHVAQELEPVLSHVGFRCICLDDRPQFADKKLFPTAEDVKLVDFSNISATVTVGPEDYVCIMTRGHAFDAVVQAQMMKTPACYIGLIGSRAKIAGVRAKLKSEYGFADEEFARVTTPIGLPIKAETPAEIAISIAGQMIEIRAERNERN